MWKSIGKILEAKPKNISLERKLRIWHKALAGVTQQLEPSAHAPEGLGIES